MTFTNYMMQTVQRYIEETGLTPEGILAAQYFTALAYFREKHHYFRLEDIEDPQPGVTYYIRVIGSRFQFTWDGKWVMGQEIEDSLYG